MPNMAIEPMRVGNLRPYARNARTHSKKQIKQIATSIERFGFTNPVLISDDNEIIAGHGRVEAAKLLGIENVPTVRLSHLSEGERRAYVIADNKLAQNAGWDREVLAIELQALVDVEFDIELTGFSLAEIDILIDEAKESSPVPSGEGDDECPPLPDQASVVTRAGDVWQLGRHRLACGDSRNPETLRNLMGNERADLIFTDSALQCANRRSRLWPRSDAPSRVRDGCRRDVFSRIHGLSDRNPWERSSDLSRWRDRLRVHGLAPHG
jgi:hypothetical protein